MRDAGRISTLELDADDRAVLGKNRLQGAGELHRRVTRNPHGESHVAAGADIPGNPPKSVL